MSTPAHDVVRCSGRGDDGACGREQAITSYDDGSGVRVVSTVSDVKAEWLSSFGWLFVAGGRWLCPFCAGAAGLLGGSL
jgi:hypothetical protein